MKNKKLLMLFLFLFLLRLYKIGNPPLDYSSWRQVDTDSIARNYVEYRFNVFYPQLNYNGPMPNYVQLEFQVTTIIIAFLYKYFGYCPVLARIVPILFFMLSCIYLYKLVKLKSGIDTAFYSLLFYGILPINIIYSRNIMPESALMLFTVGSLYFFLRYMDDERNYYYLLSVIFTSLAVLTKVPAAMIGIPMIYLAFSKYNLKIFRKLRMIMFPLLVFTPVILYLYFVGRAAEQKFVSGIGSNVLLPNLIKSLYNGETLRYITNEFAGKVFTLPGAVLFSIGLTHKLEKNEYVYYAWAFAALIHVLLINSVIHLDYYFIFITPVISVFMGIAAVQIKKRKFGYTVSVLVFIMLLHFAVLAKSVYNVQQNFITYGKHVMEYTKPSDLVIIGKDSPELLYTSQRKGWRLYGKNLTEENIKNLADIGAAYFIPYSPPEGELKFFLDKSYKRIDFEDGYYIYELHN